MKSRTKKVQSDKLSVCSPAGAKEPAPGAAGSGLLPGNGTDNVQGVLKAGRNAGESGGNIREDDQGAVAGELNGEKECQAENEKKPEKNKGVEGSAKECKGAERSVPQSVLGRRPRKDLDMLYKALVQRAKQASADDRLLTAKEIASILKVHVKTVYEWTGENRLNAYDLGKRSKRYDIEEVLAAVSRKRKDKDEDNQNRERNVCN